MFSSAVAEPDLAAASPQQAVAAARAHSRRAALQHTAAGHDRPDHGPAPEAADQAPEHGLPPAAQDTGVAAALQARLPDSIRGGRLDHSRPGVVALLVVAVLAATVAGTVLLRARPQPAPLAPPVVDSPALDEAGAANRQPASQLVIDVAGKVKRPGLVTLPSGSRVADALQAAGGVDRGADTAALNLARKLIDGEQLLVGIDPPPGAAQPVPPGSTGAAPLDLNAASVEQLDALPGVGPVLAQRIVDWRTEHGGFAAVDQLREVTGIGESRFADLQDAVVVP